MQLEELFDYKNKLAEDLLTTPSILELINDTVPLENAHSLMYKQVFPLEYVPETVEHGSTFVCCDVDVLSLPGKTFYKPVLYVWVFAHKSNIRCKSGGVLTDRLCSEICSKINGSMEYGMGELEFDSVKRFAPMTDYQGKVMTFFGKDFNRVFNPKKSIPTNRKNGNS